MVSLALPGSDVEYSMISIEPAHGAQYPVVRTRGLPPASTLDSGELYGVSFRAEGRDCIWPVWYADTLATLFGEPADDYGRSVLAWLRDRDRQLAAVRDGTHPLLFNLPPQLDWMDPHQRDAFVIAQFCEAFAFYFEPGMGKTATMIEIIRGRIARDLATNPNVQPRPTLVIGADPTLISDAWRREFDRWAPEIPYATLLGLKADALLETHHPVYMISRQTLGARRAGVRIALRDRWRIRTVVVDESVVMSQPRNEISRILLEDYASVPERYILSGLPAPNNAAQYWAQINFLAPGLLPVRYSEFKKKFFTANGTALTAVPEHLDTLMKRIARVALVRTQEDHAGMPEVRVIHRSCPLPAGLQEAYRIIDTDIRQLIDESDREGRTARQRNMVAIFARITRLRELCTGYIVPEKGRWDLVSDHKFRLLDQVLGEIGDHQVVVWLAFREDFANVHRLLPHRCRSAGFIWGATPGQAYRQQVLDRFRNGELQYLFANAAAIRHGLTLFEADAHYHCHNTVFFNDDYSWEKRKQATLRLARRGQMNKFVNAWILSVDGTIEPQSILPRLGIKDAQSQETMEMLK